MKADMNTQGSSRRTSVVAFYGVDQASDSVRGIYHWMSEAFQQVGNPATTLAVQGKGFTGKPSTFDREDRKIQKAGFESIKGIELTAMTPRGQLPAADWTISASYSRTDQYFVLGVVSELMTLPSPELLDWATQVADILRPEYGIGYIGDDPLKATMYAVGVNATQGTALSGEAYRQAIAISRWADTGIEYKAWRKGVVRDIYAWNFLSLPLLNSQINGISLREWIGKTPERGMLRPLSADFTLWEVNGSSAASIRSALESANLLFDWEQFE